MSRPEGHQFTTTLGNQEIVFETGRLAPQAGGAVVVRCGECVLLVTATASKSSREEIDFLPLSVELEEKLYAAGRIPGNFFRREGRPSEDAILTSRLADRPLRPLFDKTIRHEVQIIATALSSDGEKYLDILTVNGASAALMISDIPWDGPIGAVRIGRVNNEFIVNPTVQAMQNSILDLRVAGTEEAILMVEAGAEELPEKIILDGLRLAHESIQDIIAVQKQMRDEVGKIKRKMNTPDVDPAIQSQVDDWLADKGQILLDTEGSKTEQGERRDELKNNLVAAIATEDISEADILNAYERFYKKAIRQRILDDGIRPDGRQTDEIRPIWCDVGILPRPHGTAVFTRGETQILSVTTLGSPDDEQRLDSLSPDSSKRYMHHYNFPPFSTGETGRIGSTKRREIGHGALAERALVPVLPSVETFPYTIRVVSEAISSNGSTSMGSVCSSTLSLMDAGVPVEKPVSGIAMGLITEADTGRFAVLSDIQGLEDALGDMDFKVAGTRDGITALQMDIKIAGINWEALEQALAQAQAGRYHILEKMEETINQSRQELSAYAPRLEKMRIDPSKIGKLIGPGGSTIRSIQENTKTKISVDDDGMVYIAANDGTGAALAKERIEEVTATAELGAIYTGRVVKILDFGAFVEIFPGTDGLVPISQIADYHVRAIEDIVAVDDEIMVMVVDINPEGKIYLSRRAVLEGWSLEEAKARVQRRSNSNRGGSYRGSYRGNDRRRDDNRHSNDSYRDNRRNDRSDHNERYDNSRRRRY